MKNIQELFVPYELAVKAKDKGFNKPCLAYYSLRKHIEIYGHDNLLDSQCVDANAPLYQQLVDWFREDHDIVLTHSPAIWGNDWFYCNRMGKKTTLLVTDIKDYHEALNKALEESFKLI